MFDLPKNFAIFISFAAVTAVAVIVTSLYLRKMLSNRKMLKNKEVQYQQFKQETAQPPILNRQSYNVEKVEEQFRNQLISLIEFSQKSLSTSTEQLEKFLKELQQSSLRFEESSRKATEERINRMFGNLEERLSDFLISTEAQTTQSIELEVKATRNLIESYKQQQLKLIDENIIAMMEQTLNIVLGKKLSLKEQLELVYEALEKAKVDKFVV